LATARLTLFGSRGGSEVPFDDDEDVPTPLAGPHRRPERVELPVLN
jgi:hypothetical protein